MFGKLFGNKKSGDFFQQTKRPNDFICEGVLSYGVCVGKFRLLNNQVVYSISDIKHVMNSDSAFYWALKEDEYEYLMSIAKSSLGEFEGNPISRNITDKYYNNLYLCGESVATKNSFSYMDVKYWICEERIKETIKEVDEKTKVIVNEPAEFTKINAVQGTEENREYIVFIKNVNNYKIATIKVVFDTLRCSLAEAKYKVDSAPCEILRTGDKELFDRMVDGLKKIGVDIEIKVL